MANLDHLAKLKEGPLAWNQWRAKHSDLPKLMKADLSMDDLRKAYLRGADLRQADLSDADLDGADLVKANLRNANLIRAKLNGADLIEANLRKANLADAELSRANLVRADLSEANLTAANLSEVDLAEANLSWANFMQANLGDGDLNRANLGWANFTSADLSRADLSGTNLKLTILRGADLRGADLTEAHVYETVFGNTNLSGIKGLDTCHHSQPSTLDHRTLALSGPLPLAFLRGCGLPDPLIDYLPSLLNEAVKFYSCFISYSTKDQEFADRLYTDLQNKGVRCWYAPRDVKGGKKLHEQIDNAIQMQDRLLLFLSEASMNSEWVKTEISKARKREIREKRRMLFPLRLVDLETLRRWECFDGDTGRDSAQEIREYYLPDFSNWKNHDDYQKALERLLRDLRATEPTQRLDR